MSGYLFLPVVHALTIQCLNTCYFTVKTHFLVLTEKTEDKSVYSNVFIVASGHGAVQMSYRQHCSWRGDVYFLFTRQPNIPPRM